MRRAGQSRGRGDDAGFTLIELTVAMVVLGILLAMGGTGWSNYQRSQEHVSASQEVLSVLRNAQMRATAEETTYRVDVDRDARVLTVYRYDGAGYVPHTASELAGSTLEIDEAAFVDKAGTTSTSAYFYPRGTASPGRLVVSREGRDVERVVTVEGLTGRVSTS